MLNINVMAETGRSYLVQVDENMTVKKLRLLIRERFDNHNHNHNHNHNNNEDDNDNNNNNNSDENKSMSDYNDCNGEGDRDHSDSDSDSDNNNNSNSNSDSDSDSDNDRDNDSDNDSDSDRDNNNDDKNSINSGQSIATTSYNTYNSGYSKRIHNNNNNSKKNKKNIKEKQKHLTKMILQLNGKQLTKDGKTLKEYGVRDQDTIQFSLDSTRGGVFPLLSCPDVTKETRVRLGKSTKHLRKIRSGLNYGGICGNRTCEAYQRKILVHRGFDKVINPARDLYKAKLISCPHCREKFELNGFYFFECDVTVSYKKIGEELMEMDRRVTGDAWKLGGDKKVQYDFLEFKVTRLTKDKEKDKTKNKKKRQKQK